MTLPQSLLAWLLLLGVAFANGAFRALYYAKYLDEQTANRISCGLGITLLSVAVWAVTRRWRFRSARAAWRTGLLWLALTVAWEFLFFHYVAGHPWDELLRNYAFWEGRLWVLVLASLVVLPVLSYSLDRGQAAVTAAVVWALVGWASCGLVFAASRAVWGIPAALWVHLAAVPIIFVKATFFYWNRPGHLRPLPTALLFLTIAFGLDLLVVAPLLEKSFAMFASPVGTWIPFGLIFLSSLATGLFLSLPAKRRPFFQWMPEERDLRTELPGDAYLNVRESATHAINIPASPAAIWPWLVQMGYGRAGWYSHDRLDNWGHRSATAILPEFQQLKPGDLLPSTRNGKCFFEVLDLEPERHLILGSHLAVKPVRSLPWSDPSPPVSQRSTWSFALHPISPNETRLLVRARGLAVPPKYWLFINAFFFVAHIIMQRKQLLTLKQRVYRSA